MKAINEWLRTEPAESYEILFFLVLTTVFFGQFFLRLPLSLYYLFTLQNYFKFPEYSELICMCINNKYTSGRI